MRSKAALNEEESLNLTEPHVTNDEVMNADVKDANAAAIVEQSGDVKQTDASHSPKKSFLPSKFNFSHGRKNKSKDETPPVKVKNKFKKMFGKDKSTKPMSFSEPEITQETEEVNAYDNESKVNPAETGGSSNVQKIDDTISPKKTTFMSKFFKSDEKSEKTAPSLPSQVEGSTNPDDAVTVSKGESGDTITTDERVEGSNDVAVSAGVAAAVVVGAGAAKSPGMRSKFTKLFSKNDVGSTGATKVEAENNEAQEAHVEPGSPSSFTDVNDVLGEKAKSAAGDASVSPIGEGYAEFLRFLQSSSPGESKQIEPKEKNGKDSWVTKKPEDSNDPTYLSLSSDQYYNIGFKRPKSTKP